MDATLRKITDFSLQLGYDDLPPVAVHACKRRIIDTLACALGAFDAEPSRIARAIAGRVSSKTPARILGSLEQSSPELAAFANGVMIRYLDLNDATGTGGGHPSDMFGALLTAAERQVITRQQHRAAPLPETIGAYLPHWFNHTDMKTNPEVAERVQTWLERRWGPKER